MTAEARVLAQAKVNLSLRVLARETSGYHGIETLFQRLDWGDRVTVRLASGRSLDCSGPSMPATGLGPVEKNLAYRAAVAYASATGWPTGFAIEIEKHIPVGGGLGGGSANAGAVLRALDALSPVPLGTRLLEIAAPLGADVPFMACDATLALAWSRGERMLALPALPVRHIALIVPSFPVATAEAYGWVAAARGDFHPVAVGYTADSFRTWQDVAAHATNDFEGVVAQRHPEMATIVHQLKALGATLSLMSGSGSTVFGVFEHALDAAEIARITGCTPILTTTSTRVVGVTVTV